ncbi:MAG: hypothetical protein L3J52_09890 [Proteobacteria bacterium]|nr:hypothetical protein [Pseudomonadota bacterium]
MKYFAIVFVFSAFANDPYVINVDELDLNKLDTKVAEQFAQALDVWQQQQNQSDEIKYLAQSELCMLLHNYNYFQQATDCYYDTGMKLKNEAQWPYLYALVSIQLANWTEAERGFIETIRRKPGYLPAYVHRANELLKQNKISEAIKVLSNLKTNQLTNPSVLNLQGDVYSSLEQFEIAISYYQQALKIVSEANSLNYKIGMNFIRIEDEGKADAYFKKAGVVGIKLADPYLETVKARTVGEIPFLIKAKLAMQNQAYTLAINNYLKALESNPNSEPALVNISVAYAQSGNIQAAIKSTQKILSLKPQKQAALFNLAILQKQNSQIIESLESLTKYVELFPADMDAVFWLINGLKEQGNFQQALALIQKSLLVADGGLSAKLLYQAAIIQTNNMGFDVAISFLKRALIHDKNNSTVILALSKLLSSNPDKNLREPDVALQLATQALAIENSLQAQLIRLLALDELQQCQSFTMALNSMKEQNAIDAKSIITSIKKARSNDLACIK